MKPLLIWSALSAICLFAAAQTSYVRPEDLVQMNWQCHTSLIASCIFSSSPAPSPTNTSPNQSPTNTPPQALSTGGRAGIGIGATIGGLIIVAPMGWFIWRRLRGRAKQGDSHPSMAELGTGRPKPSELGSTDLDRDEIAELESRRRAAELQGSRRLPTELQGNPRAELEARRAEGRNVYEMGT